MESFVDHYTVLGLPSGEESQNLTNDEIRKAYKLKALDLHPDKRQDDPHAKEKFHRLKTSYEVLKHEKTRKPFDDSLLRIHRQKQVVDSKRRKMMSDLEKRERCGFTSDEEKVRVSKRLEVEVERIRAKEAKKRRVKEAKNKVVIVPIQREEQNDFVAKSDLDDEAYTDLVMQSVLKAAKKQKIMMETKQNDHNPK